MVTILLTLLFLFLIYNQENLFSMELGGFYRPKELEQALNFFLFTSGSLNYTNKCHKGSNVRSLIIVELVFESETFFLQAMV